MIHQRQPIGPEDMAPWYEEEIFDRKLGCLPLFAILVLSWSAIGFVVWSLW